MDRSDRNVVVVLEFDEGHAFTDLELRQMHRVVDVELRKINLDELRKILRQAFDFDLDLLMLDHAAAGLDAGGHVAALEVQRHMHAQQHVGEHALQVHVHDLVAHGMAMQVLEHGLFGLAGNVDGQNVGIERLDLEMLHQFVVADLDRLRLLFATINDGGHLALMAQAAARTLPVHRADFGGDSKSLFHALLRGLQRNAASATRRSGSRIIQADGRRGQNAGFNTAVSGRGFRRRFPRSRAPPHDARPRDGGRQRPAAA